MFWALMLIGAALRLVALGHVPAGLNGDEASTGVDALALVRTGMDRWGNPWPVWFPAWGSGMNALYAYIAVPVIRVFGLSVLSLRAIGAVFGVLTLPVAYLTARLYFGRGVALATLALLAVLPWHVMASRWALDSNLAPFWFTLGLLTIGKALRLGGRLWPIVAFLPWAVALYAYPTTMLPIATSGLAIMILYRRIIRPNLRPWAIGIAAAGLVDVPFLLFLAKSYLGLPPLPFERALPFSIPLLPATRLSQIKQPPVSTIVDNLTFILGGFRDGAIWHQSVYFLPLTGAMPLLILLGTLALGWRQVQARQPHVILIVLLSATLPICLLPLNLTRLNWFYIPGMMVAAHFLLEVVAGAVAAPSLKRLLIAGSVFYFAVFAGLFTTYYFRAYNQEIPRLDTELGNGFRVGLEDALKAEMGAAGPDEPALVDVGTVHPYLYVLFFGLADIESFQATRQVRVEDGVYRVSRFGRFFFERDALPAGQGFVFVTRSNDLPCAQPQILRTDPLWAVGRCLPAEKARSPG